MLAKCLQDAHVVLFRGHRLSRDDFTQHTQGVWSHTLETVRENVGGVHVHTRVVDRNTLHLAQQAAHVKGHRRTGTTGHRRHDQNHWGALRVKPAGTGDGAGRLGHFRICLRGLHAVHRTLQTLEHIRCTVQGDDSTHTAHLTRTVLQRSGHRGGLARRPRHKLVQVTGLLQLLAHRRVKNRVRPRRRRGSDVCTALVAYVPHTLDVRVGDGWNVDVYELPAFRQFRDAVWHELRPELVHHACQCFTTGSTTTDDEELVHDLYLSRGESPTGQN